MGRILETKIVKKEKKDLRKEQLQGAFIRCGFQSRNHSKGLAHKTLM